MVGYFEECGQRARPAFDDYGLESGGGHGSTGHEIAFALAFAGELSRPQKYDDRWEKKYSKFGPDNTLWLPLIRAQPWLNRKNPAKAVEMLEAVTPSELTGDSGTYCVYVRAYANLAASHLDNAEADFQEILDHPGLVLNSPAGSLARVGLARTRVQKGDTVGAKTAYETFLTLWKDADPDIPILKQAKAEYAKLQ